MASLLMTVNRKFSAPILYQLTLEDSTVHYCIAKDAQRGRLGHTCLSGGEKEIISIQRRHYTENVSLMQ